MTLRVNRALSLFAAAMLVMVSPPILLGGAMDPVHPPAMLSGTLCDDTGKPLSGAKITAQNVGALYCGLAKVQSDKATTDENGTFSLHTGFYPVYLSVESDAGTMCYPQNPYYSGRMIPLSLLQNPDHHLVLMRWATVQGNVIDRKTGNPVSEFRVHFNSFSHAPRRYASKDGRFTEYRVTPGTQTISIMADGYAPSILHAVPVRPGSVTDIGIVQMSTGPTLTGRVLSAHDSQPLAGAIIRFRDARTHAVVSYPPDELKATTDAAGRFSIQNMPLLALQLYTSIEQPGHHTLTIGNVDMSLARNGILEATFFVDISLPKR